MTWDELAYEVLEAFRKKSKDPSMKVSSYIVGPNNESRSMGFNGFPRGVEDDIKKVPERWARPDKYDWCEHAERNAIYNAARVGTPLQDCKMYISAPPCTDCARGIIQVGIKEVIMIDLFGPEATRRWADKIKIAKTMLEEAGVKYSEIIGDTTNEQIKKEDSHNGNNDSKI